MTVEIITRYQKGKPTTYSTDGGKTWIDKREFKKVIGGIKRPLYSNAKEF